MHAWAKSRAGVNNVLTLVRLSPDGMRAAGEGRIIIDGNRLVGYRTLEGPKLYRARGYYWIFAPAGGVTAGWQSVFRSRRIDGPYEDRIVLDQGSTDVNGPHQGAWVDTPAGEDWFVHFQDLGAYGRVVHLQPMTWRVDGWPVVGADVGGNGKGEQVRAWRKPHVGRDWPIEAPATSDDFASPRLGLQWQWQANPTNGWMSLAGHPGWLRLRCQAAPEDENLWHAPHLLLQKWPAAEFVVTTAVRFLPAADGEAAGLIVFGQDYAWVGVRRLADGLRLVVRVRSNASDGGREQEVASVPAPAGVAWLRVTVVAGGKCRFSASSDGRTFTRLGADFVARPGRMASGRVGAGLAARPWLH